MYVAWCGVVQRKLYALLFVLCGTVIAFIAGANLGWAAAASNSHTLSHTYLPASQSYV
jgi:hypothetical protein